MKFHSFFSLSSFFFLLSSFSFFPELNTFHMVFYFFALFSSNKDRKTEEGKEMKKKRKMKQERRKKKEKRRKKMVKPWSQTDPLNPGGQRQIAWFASLTLVAPFGTEKKNTHRNLPSGKKKKKEKGWDGCGDCKVKGQEVDVIPMLHVEPTNPVPVQSQTESWKRLAIRMVMSEIWLSEEFQLEKREILSMALNWMEKKKKKKEKEMFTSLRLHGQWFWNSTSELQNSCWNPSKQWLTHFCQFFEIFLFSFLLLSLLLRSEEKSNGIDPDNEGWIAPDQEIAKLQCFFKIKYFYANAF